VKKVTKPQLPGGVFRHAPQKKGLHQLNPTKIREGEPTKMVI
jgi:hypothetical protein